MKKSTKQQKIDRMRAALSHREGDRVPVGDGFWTGFVERCREKWGAGFDPYRHFDLDYIIITPNMDPKIRQFEVVEQDGENILIKTGFGATIRRSGKAPMPHYDGFSISSAEQMAEFEFDSPTDKKRFFEAGDDQTGITIMQMDVGLDTGAMLLKTHCPIQPEDTAQTLHDKLATQGAQAIINALAQLENLVPEQQDNNQACYATKLTKAEAKIDWSLSARVIQRRIQAFNPWPMAYCEFDGQPLRILAAQALDGPTHQSVGEVVLLEKIGLDIACGQGLLRITQLQPAGKKPMSAYDFAMSRNLIGQVLQ